MTDEKLKRLKSLLTELRKEHLEDAKRANEKLQMEGLPEVFVDDQISSINEVIAEVKGTLKFRKELRKF